MRHKLRMYHARAFADTGNAHFLPVNRELCMGHFGFGVRGHNGARKQRELIWRCGKRRSDLRKGSNRFFGRKRHTDNPGRGRKHLVALTVKYLCRHLAYRNTRLHTRLARGAVRISRVHDKRADFASTVLKMSAPYGHRRSYHAVAGEHGGGLCWRIRYSYGKI